jgi:hypothetical protein
MARLPRVVVVGVAHHVTQRGNARQAILSSDADRITYLELTAEVSGLWQSTHTGRPLGSVEFMAALEQTMLRPLIPRKAGRRKNWASGTCQLGPTSLA